jgi:hypothetical protein
MGDDESVGAILLGLVYRWDFGPLNVSRKPEMGHCLCIGRHNRRPRQFQMTLEAKEDGKELRVKESPAPPTPI